MNKIRKILIPVDFTRHSDRAVALAATIGKPFNTRMILIHVIENFTYSVTDTILVVDHYRALRAVAEPLMGVIAKKLARKGLKSDSVVVRGNPALEIVAKAKRLGADLIVMGTRGKTGIRHMVLGSVAEKVVRLAPCPVLTVRSDGTGRRSIGKKTQRRRK